MAPISRGFLTAGVLTVVGTLLVALFYVGNHNGIRGLAVFGAVAVRAGAGPARSAYLTEYFTSTQTAPVQEIAEATRTGPATTVLARASARARVDRVGHHRHRRRPRRGHRPRQGQPPVLLLPGRPSPAWACWPPPA